MVDMGQCDRVEKDYSETTEQLMKRKKIKDLRNEIWECECEDRLKALQEQIELLKKELKY